MELLDCNADSGIIAYSGIRYIGHLVLSFNDFFRKAASEEQVGVHYVQICSVLMENFSNFATAFE